MATIQYSTIDAALQVELGDMTGNVFDTTLRKQKLNEAVQWFSRMWPYEQAMVYPIVLNETSQAIYLSWPGAISSPPRRILEVLVAGKRVSVQPDTADDDPLSLVSDMMINNTLTWRLKWPDTVVFSQPLGTGTGLNDPSIVGLNLTVVCWFTWYDFDLAPSSAIDLAFENLLLLKAAELCHLWIQPIAARLGRDLGSALAAQNYQIRIADIISYMHPPLASQQAGARPMKIGGKG